MSSIVQSYEQFIFVVANELAPMRSLFFSPRGPVITLLWLETKRLDFVCKPDFLAKVTHYTLLPCSFISYF